MERKDLEQKIRKISKQESLKEIEVSMKKLSNQHLEWCYNTFKDNEKARRGIKLVELKVNGNDTVSISMETKQGKAFGVSIILK